MKYVRCFHWKKDPLRGYNSQIQNKPWRAVGRYAFGGSQEPSNVQTPAAAAQTPANAAQKGQVVKKAGEPQKKNGKETDSPNKALKEGADAPNGVPGQVAEVPQAKSDYSFMKEMERHWREGK